MKVLIIPTQHFSGNVKGKKDVEFSDLPWTVQAFIRKYKGKVFCALDESSYIKTNSPMTEDKKSQRTRTIKKLTDHTTKRAILTGTLKTKSPINLIDQFQFLDKSLFNENVYAFAEHYVIMVNLPSARGRRVQISPNEYNKIRKRMSNAWIQGGQDQLNYAMMKIHNEYSVDYEKLEHIIAHRDYSPFLNQKELMDRLGDMVMTVARKDVFDIGYDEFVYHPIKRPVSLSATAKRMGNELVQLGFTDNLVLGKAAALELAHRLKDICNGFEPIQNIELNELGEEVRTVTYRPLADNPKLDELIELLGEIGTEQNQVVVWCYRTNAFDSIAGALEKEGIPFVRYSGAESNKQKDEAEEKFMSGEARVFLANQDSAGFGLNCLRNCDYAVWYSRGDSYERHYQAMHRILRGESKAPKFAYDIYVKDSIEERNIKVLDAGRELMTDENSKSMFWFD